MTHELNAPPAERSAYHKATQATFRPVSPELGRQLVIFSRRRNIGKSLEIDGRTYLLDHISQSKNSYWRSRGFSAYFLTDRSVIRISDHWSRSGGTERSRKLNCGEIDSCFWTVASRASHVFSAFAVGAGKYPYRLIAGRCALRSFGDRADFGRPVAS